MFPLEWLTQAAERIEPYINKTPVTYDPRLEVFLKWENQQVTGSFKVRGALNKIFSMPAWEREQGLVAASAGNHGQGVAYAGKIVGAPVTIFCPNNAVPTKVQAMREMNAEVILIPGGYGDAEQAGKLQALSSGAVWVSPYNDGLVIAGQGTIGLELERELPDLVDPVWLVPIGGGGLISGIGAVIKHKPTSATLVGVQPEASPFFHAIYHRGSQEGVMDLPTLADGLAGPVEDGSVTIPLVREYVDEIILVNEQEIAKAIAYAWEYYRERIEGSGAAGLATVLSGLISTRPVVIVVSGGNIQPEVHQNIVSTGYNT